MAAPKRTVAGSPRRGRQGNVPRLRVGPQRTQAGLQTNFGQSLIRFTSWSSSTSIRDVLVRVSSDLSLQGWRPSPWLSTELCPEHPAARTTSPCLPNGALHASTHRPRSNSTLVGTCMPAHLVAWVKRPILQSPQHHMLLGNVQRPFRVVVNRQVLPTSLAKQTQICRINVRLDRRPRPVRRNPSSARPLRWSRTPCHVPSARTLAVGQFLVTVGWPTGDAPSVAFTEPSAASASPWPSRSRFRATPSGIHAPIDRRPRLGLAAAPLGRPLVEL